MQPAMVKISLSFKVSDMSGRFSSHCSRWQLQTFLVYLAPVSEMKVRRNVRGSGRVDERINQKTTFYTTLFSFPRTSRISSF